MADRFDSILAHLTRPGLARDTALLVTAQLYYRLGGFVALMILSRTLAETELGIYLFALAAAEALVVVASFALDPVLMRRVAVAPDRAGSVLSAVTGFRLAAAPVYLAGVAAVAWWSDWSIWPVMLAVAGLTIAEHVYLSLSCLFLAVDRVDLSVKIGVVVQTLFLAAVVIAMLWSPSLWTFLLVCAARVVALIGVGVAVSRHSVAKVGIGWDGSIIREAVPFALLALVTVLRDRTDVMVVGWFTDYEEVARYGLAFRAVVVSLFVPMAVAKVWYPRLVRLGLGPEGRALTLRGLALVLSLGGGAMILLAWLSGPVTSVLFGPLGPRVEPILRLALPLFPIEFAVVFLGVALQAFHRERAVLAIFGAGAVAGLVLAVAVVPVYGVNGAVAVRVAVAFGQLLVLALAARAMTR